MTIKRNYSLILGTVFIMLLLHVYLQFPVFAADDETDLQWEPVLSQYEEYRNRFTLIEVIDDISENGFRIIEEQMFPVELENFGAVIFVPALDKKYNRLALFLAEEDGTIIYKTDQLAPNNWQQGELKQPIKELAAVSFKDINKDGLTDIVIITSCMNDTGDYAGKKYKVGDALFQNASGFYQDYRISDKINRFSMNKSAGLIAAFIRDGYSTEFLYTAATKSELLSHGFTVINEQCYWRNFEKLGRLQVVPGEYNIAKYSIFMIYLVNEQGNIVWSFQPMGHYDNLYALKGMTCKDIDGDGLKDMVVLARYSYEGDEGELLTESDFAIYYQRTWGFYEETDYENMQGCRESETLSELVEHARAYWGWGVEVETND